MAKRIRIVGGVAGGMSAATRLRRLDEFADIVVYERGRYVSFANCGLPYHLGGEIPDRSKLTGQTPAFFTTRYAISVRAETEVVTIRPATQEIDVRDLATGKTTTEGYDELILAPGARAVVPAIPGIDRPGVFPLRTIPDMDAVVSWIETAKAKSALVIGGGYIGLEAAEQMRGRGLAVAITEKHDQVLTALDPEMAAHLHAELPANDVTLHLGNPVAALEAGDGAGSVAVLKNGTRIPADVVIVGAGVRPETALAVATGLALGSTGGIKVDEHLRTSDPHIWAVGDAIEVRQAVTGEPALIALAGPANRQGRTVADNIYGRPTRYPGSYGTAVVRVFNMVAACTGANEKTLKRLGRKYQALHLHPNSHAGYYPGAKSLAMKVLFDPDSGRLLGAQAVGADGADKRIDVFATALKGGLTIDDLAEVELAYAPPFGSAKDPVNLAGMAAQNVAAGLVETVQWHEVAGLLAAGEHTLLDVREAGEREAGAIPGSVSIPLGELRSRLGELPKEDTILVHCASGQRSYNACRMLTQRGFRCRNLTGSYKTWKAATA